jgi:hypothetical protein
MVSPDEVLERLIAHAKSSRTIQSLEAIHKVCSELKKRGHNGFSVSEVAAFGEGRGVPKAQSIRNKTGAPYRILIDSWRDSSESISNTGPKHNSFPQSYQWVENIEDPRLKFLVKDLVVDHQKLTADLQRMKSITSLQIDMRETARERKPSVSNAVVFTDNEMEALKAAINPSFLDQEGWTIDPRGRIKSSSGRTLFKLGFVDAVQKILSINKCGD